MSNNIEGQKIVKVRKMTNKECLDEFWTPDKFNPVMVLELEDGTKIFPSRDYEGNGGGALFGMDKKKNAFVLLEQST